MFLSHVAIPTKLVGGAAVLATPPPSQPICSIQRLVLGHVFQICFRISIEDQVGIGNGIIVNQVVQFRLLVHIVCYLVLNSDGVNGDHAAIGKLQLYAVCIHVKLTGK